MRITKEIIENVLVNYGYDEIANVVVIKDKDNEDIIRAIRLEFPLDCDSAMDIIYSISGIVQNIIDVCYWSNRYDCYDIPSVVADDDCINVCFRSNDFISFE